MVIDLTYSWQYFQPFGWSSLRGPLGSVWWPPVLLSDYRCGSPAIQVKQESTIWQPHACHICLLSHDGTCKQPPSCHEGHEHSQHVTDGRLWSSRKQKAARQSQEAQLASGLGLGSLSFRASLQIRQHTAIFATYGFFQCDV